MPAIYSLRLNNTIVTTKSKAGAINALISDLLDLSSRHGVKLGTMVLTGKVIKPKRRLIAKVSKKADTFDHAQHEAYLESKEGHDLDFDFGDDDKAVNAKLAEPTLTKWYLDHWVRHPDGDTYSLTEKFAERYGRSEYMYHDTREEAEAELGRKKATIKNGSKYWFVLKSVTL